MRLLDITPGIARGHLVEALTQEEQDALAQRAYDSANIGTLWFDCERKSQTQFAVNRRLARYLGLVEGSS